MTKKSVATRISESNKDRIEELAEQCDMSESEVLRHAIDQGLRAHKYYEEFVILPESECNADSDSVAKSEE
jgi:predicted transcriptional regulator